jgi:hypothetical protein
LRELREAGEAATLRVGVLGPETSPTVLAEIDVSVNGVASCAATLLALAARLAEEAESALGVDQASFKPASGRQTGPD